MILNSRFNAQKAQFAPILSKSLMVQSGANSPRKHHFFSKLVHSCKSLIFNKLLYKYYYKYTRKRRKRRNEGGGLYRPFLGIFTIGGSKLVQTGKSGAFLICVFFRLSILLSVLDMEPMRKRASRKLRRGGYRPRGYKMVLASVTKPRFNSSMCVEIQRQGNSDHSSQQYKVTRMRHTARQRFLRGWVRVNDRTGFYDATADAIA